MHQICHFEIPADNPERARKFYGKLFGWGFAEMTMGDTPYWTIKTPAGISGGLIGRKMTGQGLTNYVEVESVADSLKKAESLGAKVVVGKTMVPAMGYFGLVLDPEKNLIGLWQVDPQAR